MTKGQHGNKEAKKPKKDKPVSVPLGGKEPGLPAPVSAAIGLQKKR
jgi:hypothetical protein